uniref:Protein kinase domain-containing protein n=1 Tax=Macrostomum lignano TaxID=282301 RepID=A0A1I8JQA6_9PLAT
MEQLFRIGRADSAHRANLSVVVFVAADVFYGFADCRSLSAVQAGWVDAPTSAASFGPLLLQQQQQRQQFHLTPALYRSPTGAPTSFIAPQLRDLHRNSRLALRRLHCRGSAKKRRAYVHYAAAAAQLQQQPNQAAATSLAYSNSALRPENASRIQETVLALLKTAAQIWKLMIHKGLRVNQEVETAAQMMKLMMRQSLAVSQAVETGGTDDEADEREKASLWMKADDAPKLAVSQAVKLDAAQMIKLMMRQASGSKDAPQMMKVQKATVKMKEIIQIAIVGARQWKLAAADDEADDAPKPRCEPGSETAAQMMKLMMRLKPRCEPGQWKLRQQMMKLMMAQSLVTKLANSNNAAVTDHAADNVNCKSSEENNGPERYGTLQRCLRQSLPQRTWQSQPPQRARRRLCPTAVLTGQIAKLLTNVDSKDESATGNPPVVTSSALEKQPDRQKSVEESKSAHAFANKRSKNRKESTESVSQPQLPSSLDDVISSVIADSSNYKAPPAATAGFVSFICIRRSRTVGHFYLRRPVAQPPQCDLRQPCRSLSSSSINIQNYQRLELEAQLKNVEEKLGAKKNNIPLSRKDPNRAQQVGEEIKRLRPGTPAPASGRRVQQGANVGAAASSTSASSSSSLFCAFHPQPRPQIMAGDNNPFSEAFQPDFQRQQQQQIAAPRASSSGAAAAPPGFTTQVSYPSGYMVAPQSQLLAASSTRLHQSPHLHPHFQPASVGPPPPPPPAPPQFQHNQQQPSWLDFQPPAQRAFQQAAADADTNIRLCEPSSSVHQRGQPVRRRPCRYDNDDKQRGNRCPLHLADSPRCRASTAARQCPRREHRQAQRHLRHCGLRNASAAGRGRWRCRRIDWPYLADPSKADVLDKSIAKILPRRDVAFVKEKAYQRRRQSGDAPSTPTPPLSLSASMPLGPAPSATRSRVLVGTIGTGGLLGGPSLPGLTVQWGEYRSRPSQREASRLGRRYKPQTVQLFEGIPFLINCCDWPTYLHGRMFF